MPVSCFSAISAGEKDALCFAEASAVPTQDTCAIIQEDGWYRLSLNLQMEEGFLTLHTALAPEALKEKRRHWEPWGHRIDFDNGVSTKDFRRRIPFSQQPLNKLRFVEPLFPLRSCLARNYSMSAVAPVTTLSMR